jgi:DNA-binding PucR family transcriptional regulator
MTDRADHEVPQEAADSAKASVSTGAEIRSNPEISAPMLDVHVPHQAVHTWRDFLIHIATISVGLLIAIGLEQTVEAIHHQGERRALIASMRDEARQNLNAAQQALDSYSARATWFRESVDVVRRATTSNGAFNVALPAAAPFPQVSAPLLPAWSVAKSNGKAALLPDERAKIYERLSHEADELENAKERWRKANLDLTATGLRLGTVIAPGATLHLTIAEHDIMVQSLASVLASQIEVIQWNAAWAGACDAIANDATSLEAITPYLKQHISALPSQFK